jgi:sulfur carrier protein ThiS
MKIMDAKLVLRDKVYEVRPGMSLLDALKKNNIVPESVIAVCDGEMITDDEILHSGEEVKLIAVISGGAGNGSRDSDIFYKFKKTNHNAHERKL